MITVIKGDLFRQQVDCFVNPWNTNYIPWFLLWPPGVSRKLRKVAGYKPFNEILWKGFLKPGQAIITSGGKLPQSIIHVVSLKWYWGTNLSVIENCTRNALLLAQENNITSMAFPLLGSGMGGLDSDSVLSTMKKVVTEKDWGIRILIVDYNK